MIPESHPLQQLFIELVGRHYAEEIGIRDPQIVNYVAHLLAEFCEAEQLFKIRNAAGQATDRRRRDAAGIRSGVRAGAFLRPRTPGAQTHRRLHAVFHRHVSRRASTTFACAAIAWRTLWTG